MTKYALIFLTLLPSLLSTACASFHTVSSTELESRNLIGEWSSSSGSRLNIYCSGALTYEINGSNSILGDTKNSCNGCSVNEIQGDRLILGPMIATKFRVSRWPYKDGDVTKMVAEDYIWVQESTKSCK